MRRLCASFLCVAVVAAALADEPTETSCSIISRESNGALKTTPMATLKVMEQTAKDGTFTLPRGAPKDVQAILCNRSSIMPAAHDYKLLQAGFTLYVTDDLNRVAALGLVDGQVQLNMVDGAMTQVEQSQASPRLRDLQAEIQKAR
jgi:hypothetical protein